MKIIDVKEKKASLRPSFVYLEEIILYSSLLLLSPTEKGKTLVGFGSFLVYIMKWEQSFVSKLSQKK